MHIYICLEVVNVLFHLTLCKKLFRRKYLLFSLKSNFFSIWTVELRVYCTLISDGYTDAIYVTNDNLERGIAFLESYINHLANEYQLLHRLLVAEPHKGKFSFKKMNKIRLI